MKTSRDMGKDGVKANVDVPATKNTLGENIPKDQGAPIGKTGSPIKTVGDSGITAPNKPFGSGTGEINAKV